METIELNTMKWKQIIYINYIKTIWFNFRYLPLDEALRFPVLLARKVKIRHCHRSFCEFKGNVKFGVLRFGFGNRKTNIAQQSSVSIYGKMIIRGSGVHAFGPGTRLNIGKDGVLTIGSGFRASVNNRIHCYKSIVIGEDNLWPFDNVVMDTDSHQILSDAGELLNIDKSVIFGNHVWLGCRSVVLKGTEIPDGCIVASGSKLSGVISEENCIITTGKKIIRRHVYWSHERPNNFSKQ